MQGKQLPDATSSPGPLVIVGGAEDRSGESAILRRFLALIQRPDPCIAVLTAANVTPEKPWGRYDDAFRRLGVQGHEHLRMPDERSAAALAELAARIAQADAILMSGGDQRRLMSLIGGTPVEHAILDAHMRGICIAGSSAGASAMSRCMLADGQLHAGLGFLHNVVIDQHFSQRNRLPRLIAAVAGQPLIGAGVDEDTAIVFAHGEEIEVVGSGGVTLVDGRRLSLPDTEEDAVMRLTAGRHRLPSAWRFHSNVELSGK
jgi:cyanophycinase